MIDLGIRIELYDPATPDTASRRLLGALCRNGGYAALAVPEIGTQLSVSSLRITTRKNWRPFILGSSLRVLDVIHTPVPQREDTVPAWWDQPGSSPSVTVVLRAALQGSSLMLRPRLEQFAADGWTLQDAAQGSTLERAWHLAERVRTSAGSV
ncbi:hypothetical protein [Streptomyces sp. NPDC054865]